MVDFGSEVEFLKVVDFRDLAVKIEVAVRVVEEELARE
jgi:hypothetical protein